MKKLIMAVAIVCATVAVQAATHNWSFATGGAILDGYNATSVGGTHETSIGAGAAAYLIYAGTSTGAISQGDLLTALRTGKTVTEAAGSALLATSSTGANGYVQAVDFTTADATYALDANNKLNAYMVVVKGDNVYISPTQKTAYNDTVTPTFAPAYAASKFLRDKDGSIAYGNPGWYAANVPEPTSALLLVLGMAGLALRRRRA